MITDQQSLRKTHQEYKELGDFMDARNVTSTVLTYISKRKTFWLTKAAPNLQEMACEKLADQRGTATEDGGGNQNQHSVPGDSEDDKHVQMERKAGTRGDEAALFAC